MYISLQNTYTVMNEKLILDQIIRLKDKDLFLRLRCSELK